MTTALQGKSQLIQNDEQLCVTRWPATQYKDGKPVNLSPPLKFMICGNVQPLSGKDLLIVPEGNRDKEQYWIFTQARLELADKITRNGVNFEVQTSEGWGSFYQARIMRIDVGPDTTTGL